MPILVDDIQKAREVLHTEARSAGLRIVTIEPNFDAPEIHVKVEAVQDFVDLARELNARIIYVLDSTTDTAKAAETLEMYEQMETKFPQLLPSEDFGRSMRRLLTVTRDLGAPEVCACFNHAGLLHNIRIVDKDSWPALEAMEKSHQSDDDLDFDEVDDELADKDAVEIAEEIIEHLKNSGVKKPNLRRDAHKYVAKAADELYPSPDELSAPSREEVQKGMTLAEAKLQRGVF